MTENTVATVKDETVSMGEWFITLIVLSLPIIGFIMLFVWGFGSGTKKSKANYCKLGLILTLIFIVLSIVLTIAGVSIFGGLFNGILNDMQSLT